MRSEVFAAFLLAVLVATTSCGARPESPTSGTLARKLWDTEAEELAAVLIPWFREPAFEARSDAPVVRWTPAGYPAFVEPTWPDSMCRVFDEDGFRTILEIERLPDGETWKADAEPNHGFVFRASPSGVMPARELRCYKLKGDTSFDERRIFHVHRGSDPALSFAARLRVFDSMSQQKTVGELLEHLKKRYGTFEDLCARVAVPPLPPRDHK